MDNKRYYTLPSNKTTTSVKRYLSAYRRLRRACIEVFGVDAFGVDPGIRCFGLELSSHMAIKLWEYVNKKEWKD